MFEVGQVYVSKSFSKTGIKRGLEITIDRVYPGEDPMAFGDMFGIHLSWVEKGWVMLKEEENV